MALRDQPYLPLYIQDYLTDEKLNECSASTQGVYIKIMCIMHKSEKYGCILLEQKYKQTPDQIKNFCSKLVKHLPFSSDVIMDALVDLVENKVLCINGDTLEQKRMIKDNYISEVRAKAGKKGSEIKLFAGNLAKAKTQANTEYEYENEYEDQSNTNKKGSAKNCPYQKILDLYNSILPELPGLSELTNSMKTTLKSRYKEHPDLSWWEWYFKGVKECPFLMGEVKDWNASFNWLIGPKNMNKVLSGEYSVKNKKNSGINSFINGD